MRYRVLYLPQYVNRLTLPVLEKIRQLVLNGATLVAAKPIGSLGLQDSDEATAAIADEVWGTKVSTNVPHRFGKGKVYATSDLGAALRSEGIFPDISVKTAQPDSQILTLHRHLSNRDIYFVSNQRDRSEYLILNCRVRGMEPEIWHAEDGSIEKVTFDVGERGTEVKTHIDPYEAIFVIFHPSSRKSRALPVVTPQHLTTLDGSWNVAFEGGRGAPTTAIFPKLTPWNESPDPGIKYFSGSATYTRIVVLSSKWFKKGHHLILNLGEVRELASVSVNGEPQRIVWHGPYRLDETNSLKPGTNTIRITVTNLWPNRLIGDKQPGATAIAFAPQSPYRADSPLMRSGLLGPVEIIDEVPTP